MSITTTVQRKDQLTSPSSNDTIRHGEDRITTVARETIGGTQLPPRPRSMIFTGPLFNPQDEKDNKLTYVKLNMTLHNALRFTTNKGQKSNTLEALNEALELINSDMCRMRLCLKAKRYLEAAQYVYETNPLKISRWEELAIKALSILQKVDWKNTQGLRVHWQNDLNGIQIFLETKLFLIQALIEKRPDEVNDLIAEVNAIFDKYFEGYYMPKVEDHWYFIPLDQISVANKKRMELLFSDSLFKAYNSCSKKMHEFSPDISRACQFRNIALIGCKIINQNQRNANTAAVLTNFANDLEDSGSPSELVVKYRRASVEMFEACLGNQVDKGLISRLGAALGSLYFSLFNSGQYKECLEVYRKSHKLSELMYDDANEYKKISTHCALYLLNSGQVKEGIERLCDALAMENRILNNKRDQIMTYTLLCDAILSRTCGDELLDVVGALLAEVKLLDSFGKSSTPLKIMGDFEKRCGNHNLSSELYNRALSLCENDKMSIQKAELLALTGALLAGNDSTREEGLQKLQEACDIYRELDQQRLIQSMVATSLLIESLPPQRLDEAKQLARQLLELFEDGSQIGLLSDKRRVLKRIEKVLSNDGTWLVKHSLMLSNFEQAESLERAQVIDTLRRREESSIADTLRKNNNQLLKVITHERNYLDELQGQKVSSRQKIANSLHSLGSLLLKDNRTVKEGIKLLIRCLEIRRQLSNRIEPSIWRIHADLGYAYLLDGDYQSADDSLKKAHEMCNQQKKPVACFFVQLLHNRAIVEEHFQNRTKALELRQEALDICSQSSHQSDQALFQMKTILSRYIGEALCLVPTKEQRGITYLHEAYRGYTDMLSLPIIDGDIVRGPLVIDWLLVYLSWIPHLPSNEQELHKAKIVRLCRDLRSVSEMIPKHLMIEFENYELKLFQKEQILTPLDVTTSQQTTCAENLYPSTTP